MNSIIVAINHTADGFARNSLQMLLQSSVLILAVGALDWLLQNRVLAIVRYWLWMLLLIKLILPSNFSLPTALVSMPRIGEDRLGGRIAVISTLSSSGVIQEQLQCVASRAAGVVLLREGPSQFLGTVYELTS